jgi:hypothetical protein
MAMRPSSRARFRPAHWCTPNPNAAHLGIAQRTPVAQLVGRLEAQELLDGCVEDSVALLRIVAGSAQPLL